MPHCMLSAFRKRHPLHCMPGLRWRSASQLQAYSAVCLPCQVAMQSEALAELPQLQHHLTAQVATAKQLAEQAQLYEIQSTIALVSLKLVYMQVVMTSCLKLHDIAMTTIDIQPPPALLALPALPGSFSAEQSASK